MAFLQVNIMSRCLSRGININVILPYRENKEEGAGPYKTIYMLPGFSASSFQMSTGIGLRQLAAQYQVAVVVPDCENSYYVDIPGAFRDYSKFIGEELVEMTRAMFPLSHKKEDTFIGGISMGGYGALYNGLRYADVFSKVAAMSPGVNIYGNKDVHFPDGYFDSVFVSEERYMKEGFDPTTAYIAAYKQGKTMPELYICCGRDDAVVYNVDIGMINELRENNVPVLYREDNGGHDNEFWSKYLPEVFDFLTGKEVIL